MGERADRGCFAGHLVRFDHRQFAADVQRELNNRGWGAQARMAREAGVPRRSIQNLLGAHLESREPSTVFSIAAYLGFKVEAYLIWRDEEAPQRLSRFARGVVDWELFGACASLLCAGDIVELAKISGLSLRQAAYVLAGEGCGDEAFRRLRKLMKLPEYDFRPSWRYVRARRRNTQSIGA